jgi:hypothetical protein
VDAQDDNVVIAGVDRLLDTALQPGARALRCEWPIRFSTCDDRVVAWPALAGISCS